MRSKATVLFHATGETLISDSTLRFRNRDEVEAQLPESGYIVDEVQDAPDRPGREFISLARRPL